MLLIRAMVQLFSFGERWNVLFNSALPRWIEHSISHLMKISVPLHSQTFIICIIVHCKRLGSRGFHDLFGRLRFHYDNDNEHENDSFVCWHHHFLFSSWVPIRYRCSRRRNGSDESFISVCTKKKITKTTSIFYCRSRTRCRREMLISLFNYYLCFFSNHNEYCKTEAYNIWVYFFRFFKRCSLDDIYHYKMSVGLYKNKLVAELWGYHDLHTTDGESVLKRTTIAYVVYSTQTGIRLKRGHHIKESHPLSKHAFIEIVNITKVHGWT